jgi:hypothetical protein
MAIKSATVTMTADHLQDVLKGIRVLADTRVMVGIPHEHTTRDYDISDEPITNAELGYIHEFGAPEAHIPPRPFLFPWVKANKAAVADRLKIAGKFALDGKPKEMMNTFVALGLFAQSGVRRAIVQGPFIPLAKRTLAARRARGVTRTKPLIDTGQLISAVTYVIRSLSSGSDKEVGDKGNMAANYAKQAAAKAAKKGKTP